MHNLCMDARTALSTERVCGEMSEQQLVRYAEVAARVTAQGIPTTPRAVQGWIERHPDLRFKIAGRCAIRADAVALILAGVPLATVAEKMRAIKRVAPEAALVAERHPARQRPTDPRSTRARR